MEGQQIDDVSSDTFRKRSGTTDRGHEFENVMVANLALKLVLDREVKDFKISADHEAFGDFDDVVVESVSHDNVESRIAIQLKHFQNEKKTLTVANLETNPKKTGFSLKKYCTSYIELGECRTNYKFVLLTNLKCKIPLGNNIEIKTDHIVIQMSQYQSDKLIETSDDGSCYKFEIVSAADEQVVEMYKSFFESFILYTDQKGVDQLKEKVTREFQQHFECADDVVTKYFEFVSNWCQLEECKEKLKMEFMKNAIALHLLSPFMNPFSCGSVSDNFKILVEAISKFDVVVLDMKMEDVVKKMWTTTRSRLEDDDDKIFSKIVRKYQLGSGTSRNLNDTQYTKLLWLIRRCPLIVKGSPSVYNSLQLCQYNTVVILDDESNEETLENSSRFRNLSSLTTCEDIYSKLVESAKYTFQGKSGISLKVLLENNPELENEITVSDLLLMVENSCKFGGDQEDLPIPYIDRRLKTHLLDINNLNRLDEETVIVVSGAEQNRDLINNFRNIKLISVEEYVKTGIEGGDENYSGDAWPRSNQTNELGIRKKTIYVSKKPCSAEQFNIICDKNSIFEKCHHFKVRTDGLLEWVQSKGGAADLEKYVKEHDVEEVELYSVNSLNNINLITADPGMGKTVILKSIKNNIPPQFCGIILDSNDISLSCQQFRKTNGESEKIIKFILNRKFNGAEGFEVKLLKRMREKHQLLVIWDALDEITSEELEITMNIILQLSSNGIKQLVTARPHLKKTLETKFSVLSRSICRFDSQQQQFYIGKRFESHCNEEEIETITNNITDNLNFSQHIDIIGVPLQIFMLTELIISDSEKYLKQLAKMVSLADLFAYFIEEKFNVYFYEKLEMNVLNHRQKKQVNKSKENAVKNFEAVAVLLLMENQFLQELNINSQDILEEISDKEEWYGLITGINNDDGLPVFIHHSFAEFFVANYFARNYRNIPNIKNVLFRENYSNVRLFFDLILAKGFPIHIAAIYRNLGHIQNCGDGVNQRDKAGRNPLHLACSWATRHSILDVQGESDCYRINTRNDTSQGESSASKHILTFLLSHCDPLERDDIFDMDSLSYAHLCDCLFAIGIIIKNKEFDNLKLRQDLKYASNINYYSAKFGYENLINMFENPIFVITTRGDSLLHICARCNQELCLQKLLTDEYKAFIDDQNANRYTPLQIACESGHTEVAKLLIGACANVEGATRDIIEKGIGTLGLESEFSVPELFKWQTDITENFEAIFNNGPAAFLNGDTEAVKLWIDSLANLEAIANLVLTPLHLASQNRRTEVVKLLSDLTTSVEATSKCGSTPLPLSSQIGHAEAIKLMIDHSANIGAGSNNSEKPLHLACENGHTEVVKLLIDASANVEAATKDGWTPLHRASQNGHTEVVKLLIGASANVEAASKDGWTPLHCTCGNGHTAVVKLLIDASANVETVSKDGRTPLLLASMDGHTEVIKMLIDASANIEAVSSNGRTPLHWASEIGKTKVVKLLIDASAKVEATTNNGWTPLHLASKNGHTKVVKLLIVASANLEANSNGGWTPLYLASQNGNTEVVKLLIDASANIEPPSKIGWTPLHEASQNGHIEVVQLLLHSKANPNVTDLNDWTALHLCCDSNHLEIIRLLVQSGANIKAVTKTKWTPFHLAFFRNHKDIVQFFEELGLSTEEILNAGATPLHTACFKGDEKLVKSLIKSGADIETSKDDGGTPLHSACYRGHRNVVEMLLHSGANIEAIGYRNMTPLHLVCSQGYDNIVEKFVAAGANLEYVTESGRTALHLACENGLEETVKLLVQSGASLQATDSFGWTPLHLASQEGRLKIVPFLIESGADLNSTDKSGRTPLTLARLYRQHETVKLLSNFSASLRLNSMLNKIEPDQQSPQ